LDLNGFRRMPKGFLKAVGHKPKGSLEAVGRKRSGEGPSAVYHARTPSKPLDIQTHRAACPAPLSFADYQEMQLHQYSDLTVLAFSPRIIPARES
jgi:hypothetical protein